MNDVIGRSITDFMGFFLCIIMKIKKEVRIEVFNKFNQKCAYCGCLISFEKFHIDHIKPIFRGYKDGEIGIQKGTNTIENLNPSCASCNSSKSTFSIEKWRKELELKASRIRRDSSTFRILERFNLVAQVNEKVFFYFEKNERLD